MRIFKKHDASDVHKYAVEKQLQILLRTTRDTAHKKEKQINPEYLLKCYKMFVSLHDKDMVMEMVIETRMTVTSFSF